MTIRFNKFENQQIRHQATHKVGCQPGDFAYSGHITRWRGPLHWSLATLGFNSNKRFANFLCMGIALHKRPAKFMTFPTDFLNPQTPQATVCCYVAAAALVHFRLGRPGPPARGFKLQTAKFVATWPAVSAHLGRFFFFFFLYRTHISWP